MENKEGRRGIIGAIRNPLGFFSLALLIIEGAITAILFKAQLSEGHLFFMIILMAFLFLWVVVTVTIITVKIPENLYEQIAKQVKEQRDLLEYLTGDSFKDAVDDAILKRVKPESLKGKEEKNA